VQEAAMTTWKALGRPDLRSFRDNLLRNAEVARHFDAAKLDQVMDPQRDFAQVETIFRRVFGPVAKA
jgi:adenylosuccinate lyase